jgi:hypothetical protein
MPQGTLFCFAKGLYLFGHDLDGTEVPTLDLRAGAVIDGQNEGSSGSTVPTVPATGRDLDPGRGLSHFGNAGAPSWVSLSSSDAMASSRAPSSKRTSMQDAKPGRCWFQPLLSKCPCIERHALGTKPRCSMCAVITLSNVPYPPRNSSRSLGGPSIRRAARASARPPWGPAAELIASGSGSARPSRRWNQSRLFPPADERLLAFVLWG